jgi:hypothetical protein
LLGLREIPARQQMLGPGDQVYREYHDGEPAGVDCERSGREVVQPGILRAADAVFDPGVRAVSGVEVGELPGGGVGGECGVAPPVTFLERVELRAGMGVFPAYDHPAH